MNSNVVFGQYYYGNSWMHKLDPRTKIIAVMIYMISIFLVNSIYILLSFTLFTIIILVSTKIPFSKFLNSIKMLSYLLFLTFIFQVMFRTTGDLLYSFEFSLTVYNLIIIIVLLFLFIFSKRIIKKGRFILFLLLFTLALYIQFINKSGYLITNYKINLYSESLLDATFLITRLVTMILTSSILTLTTKPTELNSGLEKLFRPLDLFYKNASGILSMMISIALRNIPTLINEANKILKAQASRGVDFKEGKFKEKITQIISLIVPMFIIAYKKAEDLSDAMEARGYNPHAKRTSIHVLKFKLSDILVFLFITCLLTSMIVLKIVVGI